MTTRSGEVTPVHARGNVPYLPECDTPRRTTGNLCAWVKAKSGEPVQPEPPFFIFDGECGFCRKWAAWLRKRLPAGTLLVAYQQIDNLAVFGLTESEVRTASYWIDADGTAHRGADSFASRCEELRFRGARLRRCCGRRSFASARASPTS